MLPIAYLVLVFGRGPLYRYRPKGPTVDTRRALRGRSARYNASAGVWQVFDGDRCVGEVATQDEAITRVTDPSACLAMGPDRYPVI